MIDTTRSTDKISKNLSKVQENVDENIAQSDSPADATVERNAIKDEVVPMIFVRTDDHTDKKGKSLTSTNVAQSKVIHQDKTSSGKSLSESYPVS